MNITFESIKESVEIKTYIKQADLSLKALGYTEHSFAHVCKCAQVAGDILQTLNYPAHDVELTRIAAYMHDIGNVINRVDHAQSGAVMAFRILDKMGMPYEDVAKVVTAIGNHDENTAFPVNPIAAALILADKSDVRRSRVRNRDFGSFDIHDRVNYAAVKCETRVDVEEKMFILDLTIDTTISPVIDYFEIFLQRMLLCRKAAEFFELQFQLIINGSVLC